MHAVNTALALAFAAAPLATAHYTFSQLIVNDEVIGDEWQYVREHTNMNMPTQHEAITTKDFRCQPGAESGAGTEVYTVQAGDEVGLKVAYDADIFHPGPAQIYMSKAPGNDVSAYDGSGDWFKVSESLLCGKSQDRGYSVEDWCSMNADRLTFKMPSRIPAGQYLIRAEHLALHGDAEFYFACAQVNVEGTDAGAWAPTRTVQFPGAYEPGQKGLDFNLWGEMEGGYPDVPGPELIIGGQRKGSTDGSDDTLKDITKRAVEFAGSLAARAAAVVRGA